jgi:hypothetical protein
MLREYQNAAAENKATGTALSVLMLLYVLVALTCFFAADFAFSRQPGLRMVGGAVSVGVKYALLQLTTIALTFGTESHWRRQFCYWITAPICFVGVAVSICYSWLGFGLRWESVWMSCRFAAIFLFDLSIGFQLPLWIARLGFGCRLVRDDPTRPSGDQERKLSIRDCVVGSLNFAVVTAVLRLVQGTWVPVIDAYCITLALLVSCFALSLCLAVFSKTRYRWLILILVILVAGFGSEVASRLLAETRMGQTPVFEYMLGTRMISLASYAISICAGLMLLRTQGWRLAIGVQSPPR